MIQRIICIEMVLSMVLRSCIIEREAVLCKAEIINSVCNMLCNRHLVRKKTVSKDSKNQNGEGTQQAIFRSILPDTLES